MLVNFYGFYRVIEIRSRVLSDYTSRFSWSVKIGSLLLFLQNNLIHTKIDTKYELPELSLSIFKVLILVKNIIHLL